MSKINVFAVRLPCIINPARNQRVGGERDKKGERKRWGYGDRRNSTREGHGGEKEEMQIWVMVNSRMRSEKHQERMRGRKSEDQEGAERMSEGRDAEIQREKTNVSP